MATGSTDKLGALARTLRGALAPIVEDVAGPGGTPALLVRRLGIDRSLAGRLSRALRTDDDLEFLHFLPAPTGLRILLDAAAECDGNAERIKTAQSAVDRFHALIDETPGGRATLDAAISAHSTRARERNEKSSKQAIYKAMSYLLGIQCDGEASCFIMQPADDGETVECLDLNHKVAIRRLRPTAPTGLFGHRLEANSGDDGRGPHVTTIDREAANEPGDLIIRKFSSETLPNLEEYETGPDTTTIALAEDEPLPDTDFTVTLGWFLRGVFQQFRSPGRVDDCRAYMASFPCRTLVRDVFIRDDLHAGRAPEVTQYMPRQMRPELVRHQGKRGRLDTVDIAAPIEHLGYGLGNTRVQEIPSYGPLLEFAFEKSGWAASRFRGYRVKITYPVPFLYMSWWFALPDKPKGP
ncbi:MAG: hypothetical protein DHS20C21_14890 [Gemmatimonadota bacterium]|nr:MAG: hypothetical protein DHS20C21_14890 [Gemmatimonadota bacterium]